MDTASERISALPCWRGSVSTRRLPGGITNVNYVVEDAGEKFVVRLGGDIPVHQVMRFNELAASRAAWAAGVSPEVVYAEPGVMVLRFVEGRVFAEADVRKPANLERVVSLLKQVHHDIPRHLRGPVLLFWVFHVIRDYSYTLIECRSRHAHRLPRLIAAAEVKPTERPFWQAARPMPRSTARHPRSVASARCR